MDGIRHVSDNHSDAGNEGGTKLLTGKVGVSTPSSAGMTITPGRACTLVRPSEPAM